jgi:hypothetical protein
MGASVTPSIGAKIKAGVERLNNPFVRIDNCGLHYDWCNDYWNTNYWISGGW